jgi:hypothetical protein
MLAADDISQTPPALNDPRLAIFLRAGKRAVHKGTRLVSHSLV